MMGGLPKMIMAPLVTHARNIRGNVPMASAFSASLSVIQKKIVRTEVMNPIVGGVKGVASGTKLVASLSGLRLRSNY